MPLGTSVRRELDFVFHPIVETAAIDRLHHDVELPLILGSPNTPSTPLNES